MTKFSNKSKKNYFWHTLGPIFGTKIFFKKKSGSVTHNTLVSNTMLSFRKKLMSQSQENFRTERQKDRRTEGRKDRRTEGQRGERTDGQALIHRTLPVTAGGPKNTNNSKICHHFH